MRADCHIHIILDGASYKTAVARHKERPFDPLLRERLAHYKALGFSYLRDGGDRWDVSLRAKALAGEYGIRYASPAFPIYKKEHYGGFIGRGYGDLKEYVQLLKEVRLCGGDFVKLMLSGIMDFDCYGSLLGEPLTEKEIKTLIHIAHEEGFSVMAHANGTQAVLPAVEAGAESVEHGAYLNRETLQAMAERETIWVPTLTAIGNLRNTDRLHGQTVERILHSAMENITLFAQMGGLLAPGSDGGAYGVPHGEGGLTEYRLLEKALGTQAERLLTRGIQSLRQRF